MRENDSYIIQSRDLKSPTDLSRSEGEMWIQHSYKVTVKNASIFLKQTLAAVWISTSCYKGCRDSA